MTQLSQNIAKGAVFAHRDVFLFLSFQSNDFNGKSFKRRIHIFKLIDNAWE